MVSTGCRHLPDALGTGENNPNLPGLPSLLYDGGTGLDTLVYTNLSAGFDQTYALGDGTGAVANEGEILTQAGGNSLQLYFTDLEPITTQSSGGNQLTVIGDTGPNQIQVVPNGAGTRVQDVSGAYESFDFAPGAFSFLSIYGHDGGDTIEMLGLGSGENALSSIILDGRTPTAGDDDAADTLRVGSNERPSDLFGIPTQMFGGGGNDTLQVFNNGLSVSQIMGEVTADGGAGDDTLIVDDSGSGGGSETVEITGTTIQGITGFGGGGGVINYTSLGEGRVVVSSNGAGHVYNVMSTAADLMETELNTGGGSDTININDGSDTANGVVSPIDLNAQGGDDTLNIEDFADGAGNQFHMNATAIGGGGFRCDGRSGRHLWYRRHLVLRRRSRSDRCRRGRWRKRIQHRRDRRWRCCPRCARHD